MGNPVASPSSARGLVMDRPPYSTLLQRHGDPHAVRGADGAPRGHGGRGYGPPSSFVPVGGRDYAPPSSGRGYAPPSSGRGYAQPSPPFSFVPVGSGHHAQRSFTAAAQGQTVGGRGYAQNFEYLAAAGRQPLFRAPGLAAGWAQPLIPAYHGVAMDADGRGSHAAGGGGYAQNLAAAPGEYLAAAGEQPVFQAPGLAAGWGQPLIPAYHGVAMDADRRAYHAQNLAAAPGQYLAAAGGQPLFRAPGLAAGRGKHLIPAYHGVAMDTFHHYGRNATAPFQNSGTHSNGSARTGSLCDVPVETVNRENYHQAFRRIKHFLLQRTGHVYISLDLEYAASASTNLGASRPYCSSQWYSGLKDFVNAGDVVQLGMVLAFDGQCQAYEINLHIDPTSSKYNKDSIQFLLDNGHDLEDHKNRGVLAEWVYADLIRHLPFHDESVTWVTFHADRDLGFLMKLAVDGGRGMLPDKKSIFLHDAKRFFPVMFDVRVLAQLVIPRYTGSLKTLADKLCIERSGREHFASSDALVTFGCYLKILQEYCADHEKLLVRSGLMSGAEELEMAIRCALPISYSAIYVSDVPWQKYPEESARVHETMQSNFNIIGLQVLVPASSTVEVQSSGDSAQDRYQRMMAMLDSVDSFQVLLCFMNGESKIAYGRVLRFTIDTADQAQELARLLASSGATHDPGRIWVTIHGARGIACLLRSFTAPVQMAPDHAAYVSCRSCCFPSLIDLAVVADDVSEIPLLPTGCKGDLADMSTSLGIARHRCDVVTMLRCYLCFRDRGDLGNSPPGKLKEYCCSTCKK